MLPFLSSPNVVYWKEGGEIGDILQIIIHYERGDWEFVQDSESSAEETSQAYLQSIQWAEHFHGSVA